MHGRRWSKVAHWAVEKWPLREVRCFIPSSSVSTSESVHTSLSHKRVLHRRLRADVLLEGDGVLHRFFLLCLEILCHRKYTELEALDSKAPSQAALEKLRPPSHAVSGFLIRKIKSSANIYTKLHVNKLTSIRHVDYPDVTWDQYIWEETCHISLHDVIFKQPVQFPASSRQPCDSYPCPGFAPIFELETELTCSFEVNFNHILQVQEKF